MRKSLLFSMMALALPTMAWAADVDYCTPSGNSSHAGRYISALTVTPENGSAVTVTGQSGLRQAIYVDQTATVVNAVPGQRIDIKSSGADASWMHTYVYVDFDQNGWNVDNTKDTPNGDLVWFNAYSPTMFADGNKPGSEGGYTDGKTSDGGSAKWNADLVTESYFVVPEGTPAGDYRVRYKTDWNDVDPCGSKITGNTIQANGGTCIDFTLHVGAEAAETFSFTVPSASDYEGLASLAFGQGTVQWEAGTVVEGLAAGTKINVSATTATGYAIVGATVDGVDFELAEILPGMGLYSGEFILNSNVDKSNLKIETAAAKVLTITQPEGGVISVTSGYQAVESGASVNPGSALLLSIRLEAGYKFVTFTLDGEPVEGNTITMPNKDAVISATLETIDYCYDASTTSRTDRYVTSIDVNGTTVEGNGSTANRPIYVDQTTVTANVVAGEDVVITPNANAIWTHTYVYVDFDQNGWNVDLEKLEPNGDLVYFSYYSSNDTGTGVNSNGDEVSANMSVQGVTPRFTVPLGTPVGDYRIRFKTDWNCSDPCGRGADAAQNSMSSNGCTMIDFILHVESPYLEKSRKVTIASTDEAAGTVEFLQPATTNKTTTTNLKNVKVKATPAVGADFLGWYNGEELLTEAAEYTYTGTEEVTLTAHFAMTAKYAITINQPEVGGTIAVMNGDEELVSGTEVLQGTKLTLTNTPAEGYRLLNYVVNGTETTDITFTVTEATTVSAVFEEGAIEYCEPSGTRSNGRTMTGLKASAANAVDQTVDFGLNTTQIYYNHTDQIVTVEPGATLNLTPVNGGGEWIHSFVLIDFDRNGWNVDPTVQGLNGDLVAFSRYAADGDTYYDQNGKKLADGHDYVNSFNHDIVIPEDASGDYRVRYMMTWNSVNPCGYDEMASHSACYVDFTLRVQKAVLDAPRTVAVAVAEGQAEMGNVAITLPETTESSVTTDLQNIGIKAEATAEGAQFLFWEKEGEKVTEDAEIVVNDATDVTYTAHFGWTVNYTQPENGTLVLRQEGSTANLASGLAWEPGTKLIVIATPNEGLSVQELLINGEKVEVVDNQAEFTVAGVTEISATFAEALFKWTATVTGNGHVEMWTEMGENEEPAGEKIEEGVPALQATEVGPVLYFIPNEGERLTAAVIVSADVIPLELGDLMPCLYDENVLNSYYLQVHGDVIVSAVFSEDAAGISDILFDAANGPVEYYNLQGVRIDSENLAPGVYIVRQGKVAKKVYIFAK